MGRSSISKSAFLSTAVAGFLGAATLGVIAALAAAAPARADPGRIYCFTAQNLYDYKGLTNEPTEDTLISPDGSFSNGQDWNGAYSSIDTNSGVCLGKLPPGPNDNLLVGPVSNGTTFLSTTIGGGGGAYQSLFAGGDTISSGVTLTLDTNGSPFATSVTAASGQITFQGGLSAGTIINLTNLDAPNPAQYTLGGGAYSAISAIYISGATVTAPSGATLQAPQVHLDGDLKLGGKLAASSFLTVGEFGAGTLNIQSRASVTSGNGFIGGFAGSSGNVKVNGSWTLTGYLIDGQLGTGNLNVGAGGQITTGDFMTVGAGAGTSVLDINGGGKVTLTTASGLPTDLALNTAIAPNSVANVTVDGAGTVLTINGSFNLGFGGTATMNVTGGGDVDEKGAIVRIGRYGTGTLNLVGPGSKFSFASGTIFQVGTFGMGALSLSQGFQLDTGAAAVTIGDQTSGNGTAVITGSGSSWTAAGTTIIGNSGTGAVTVSDGGLLDTGEADVTIGSAAAGGGTVSVSDGGSSWTVGGNLTIGDAGMGTVKVSGGGSLVLGGDEIHLGKSAGGSGTLSLSDAASTISFPSVPEFLIGEAGTGELDLSKGFSLSTGAAEITLGSASGSTGTATLSGGGTTWTMGQHLTVGDSGAGEVTVVGGASMVVQPGGDVYLGKASDGSGRLVLDGSKSKLAVSDADVHVGEAGSGDVSIQNGATLDWSTASVVVGVRQDSSGTIEVLKKATLKVNELEMGGAGTGTLTVGTVDQHTATFVAIDGTQLGAEGGTGNLAIGPGSKAIFNGELTIGVTGAGHMTVAGQALADGDLTVGEYSASNLSLSGGKLTAQKNLVLGANDGKSTLSLDNRSSFKVQGSVSMGGAGSDLLVAGGSKFKSAASQAMTVGADEGGGVYGLDIASGGQVSLKGGAEIRAGNAFAMSVDGVGSTFGADYLATDAVASTLQVTNGAQVNLSAATCSCTALSWLGAISVRGGAALAAPTANLGLQASLTADSGGSATFAQGLDLQAGSSLNVVGGGLVAVGAPNGSLVAGQVVVGPGGTLKGFAGGAPPLILGQLVIQSGGAVLGPLGVSGNVLNNGTQTLGDDPSIVTVNGSYTLGATGVIIAEIGPMSYSQLIVNGPVTLNGGTLEFQPVQGGTLQLGKSYNVLSASGAVTGTFADVTVAQPAGLPFIDLAPSFVDGTLEVTAVHMPGSFASVATTPDQHAVGSALDRAAPSATGALHDLIAALSFDDAPTVLADLDPLSGEGYADFAEAGIEANRQFAATLRGAAAQTSGRDTALAAFNAPRQRLAAKNVGGDPSIWMTAVGGFDHAGGLDGAHSVRTTAGGFAGGVDLSPAPHWAFGGGLGYLRSGLDVGPRGAGALDTYQGALYGGYSAARIYADAVAGYAHSAGELHRSLAPAAALTAQGHFQADQYFASGEAGVDLAKWNGVKLTPFAALDAVRYVEAAFTETGAAELGLAVDGRRTDSLRSDLGVQLSTAGRGDAGAPFVASLRLGWGHEFADPVRSVAAAFIGAPDVSFTVAGPPETRDFAVIGLEVGANLHEGANLSARYDADVSGRTLDQLLSLNAHFAW